MGGDPNVVPRCPYCGYNLIMVVWFDHQTLASFGRANADDYEIICPHCGHERMPVPSSCGVYKLKW